MVEVLNLKTPVSIFVIILIIVVALSHGGIFCLFVLVCFLHLFNISESRK